MKQILIAIMAVLLPAAYFLGVGVGGTQEEPEPVREIGTPVYTVEMEGAVVTVKTGQGYINQLSEHTMLITDRSLDDVRQEILDVMDEVEL